VKFISEFRDGATAGLLAERIRAELPRPLKFMEVCGTHTMAIFQHGLKALFPPELELISGPGCPVCVTSPGYLGAALEIARRDDTVITTYGDMVRVPGPSGNLELARSQGAAVRTVYSVEDALEVAKGNPSKKVVFLGVGFETTVPTAGAAILKAAAEGLDNFFILSAHKTMPRPLRLLAEDPELGVDGFILPAHVSTIIGSEPYRFLPEEFGIPCVIAGFEPLDILAGILMLIRQINRGRPAVEVEYKRVMRPEGNLKAQEVIREVFEPEDAVWRGLGLIPASGLGIRDRYRRFDARALLDDPELPEPPDPPGCICGQVLAGRAKPPDCPLFRTACRPDSPVGACMVSQEGTCAAYYKYQ